MAASRLRSASRGGGRGAAGGVPGVLRARNSPEGRARVGEVQRARIVRAAAEVLWEHGYEHLSVTRVTGGAHVSRRTFYELFDGREDCFLAVFEEAVGRARARVLAAYETAQAGGEDWCGCVRAGLTALLELFDEEPGLASVVVVDALRADTRVLESRARTIAEVSGAVHAGGMAARGKGVVAGGALSPVTGEGVVGGVLAVLHTRLSGSGHGSLLGLRNTLMAMVVLPYLGASVARRELDRPGPRPVRRNARRKGDGARIGSSSPVAGNPLAEVPMRLTYRTARVLEAAARCPGASNRQIGEGAGAWDPGQVSKLLRRLEHLGLLCNAGSGRAKGEANAWSLTPLGERVARQLNIDENPEQGRGERER